MKNPERKKYDTGWRWTCPCGLVLSTKDSRSGWGRFGCSNGHRWWHQYGDWTYEGCIVDEPDPVLAEEERHDEWLMREGQDVWGL